MSWLEKTLAYYYAFGFPTELLVDVINREDMVRFNKILAYAKKYNELSVLNGQKGGKRVAPLIVAFYKNKSMMLKLLEAGADIDASLGFGSVVTILHDSCSIGRKGRIRLFILYGADYNGLLDSSGRTALQIVREWDSSTKSSTDAEEFLLTTVETVNKLHQYERQGNAHFNDRRYAQAIEYFRQAAAIYWRFAEDEKLQSRIPKLGTDPENYPIERRLYGEHYRQHAFINYRNIRDCFAELMKDGPTGELREEYVRFLKETAEKFAAADYPHRGEYFRNKIEEVVGEEVVAEATDPVGVAEQYDGLRHRKDGYQRIPDVSAEGVVAGHGV